MTIEAAIASIRRQIPTRTTRALPSLLRFIFQNTVDSWILWVWITQVHIHTNLFQLTYTVQLTWKVQLTHVVQTCVLFKCHLAVARTWMWRGNLSYTRISNCVGSWCSCASTTPPPPTLFKGQLWKVMWYAGKHLDTKQLLKKSFFIALNDFCGENTPIKLDFNPLMWQHWIQCWEGMYTCTWARIVFS